MKIKESDFLLGKLDTKPSIRNFTQQKMLNLIMVDTYKNKENRIKKEKVIELSAIDRMILEEEAKLG